MKAIYWTALLFVISQSARSEDMPNARGLFEHICMGSRLDIGILEKSVAATASQLKMRAAAMPIDDLRVVNPDAKKGWGLAARENLYLLSYGEKQMPEGVSRSCTVSVEADEHSATKSFISSRFKNRVVTEEIQGSYRVIVYELSLMGFQSPMYASIQSTDSKLVPVKMTSIAFFELASRR